MYNAAAPTPITPWSYRITDDSGRPVSKFRVKRKDTVQWFCTTADWAVHFKGGYDGKGNPLNDNSPFATDDFNGPKGPLSAAKGGTVESRVNGKDRYSYDVTLDFGGGNTVSVDPEIIIDENPDLDKHGRGKAASGAKSRGASKRTGKGNKAGKKKSLGSTGKSKRTTKPAKKAKKSKRR